MTNLRQAKNVVLSGDPADPSKFERETTFLVNLIVSKLKIDTTTKFLDFGCGMGRVSRDLIKKTNCSIIGLDTSESMLTLAKDYVDNTDKFFPCTSYQAPSSIDVCLASFVLQHVQNPMEAIDNIYDVIKPGGYFVLLNECIRMIPADVDDKGFVIWQDDFFDVYAESAKRFQKAGSERYINPCHTVAFYQKPS